MSTRDDWPRYLLTFRNAPGSTVPVGRMLAQLLRYAKRVQCLECTEVAEVPAGTPTAAAGASGTASTGERPPAA
jgi:hypothetical protein